MEAELAHDADAGTVTLTLRQSMLPTPGQPEKLPMPIPLRTALFNRATGQHQGERLIVLDRAEQTFVFEGFDSPPVLSINRGFSAPIAMLTQPPAEDLLFLARHDDDPFARYEAMQQLVVQHLVAAATDRLGETARNDGQAAIGQAFAAVLADAALDDLMRGELLILPAEVYLQEQLDVADPLRIHREREALKAYLGQTLQAQWQTLHDRCSEVPYSLSAEARGARKLKTQALVYLASGDPAEAALRAAQQFAQADNMTDRQGALMVLCGLDSPERQKALDAFYTRFADNMLVIDKWFSLQAGSLHPHALEHAKALATHGDFTLTNPNRVRALWMAFASNPQAFHRESGEGYRLIADLILNLDPINANTAARFVTPLGRWRKMDPARGAKMKAELERIAASSALSRDTREQVSRSLDG